MTFSPLLQVLDLQKGDYEVTEQSDTGVLFEEKKMMVAVATTDDLEKTVSQKGNKFTRNSGNAYMYVHMYAIHTYIYVCNSVLNQHC